MPRCLRFAEQDSRGACRSGRGQENGLSGEVPDSDARPSLGSRERHFLGTTLPKWPIRDPEVRLTAASELPERGSPGALSHPIQCQRKSSTNTRSLPPQALYVCSMVRPSGNAFQSLSDWYRNPRSGQFALLAWFVPCRRATCEISSASTPANWASLSTAAISPVFTKAGPPGKANALMLGSLPTLKV